jgi:hypothetical protein
MYVYRSMCVNTEICNKLGLCPDRSSQTVYLPKHSLCKPVFE